MKQVKRISLKMYRWAKSVFGGYGIASFYPIKVLNQFLFNKLKSNFVIVEGNKMYLDPEDSLEISVNANYEVFETAVLKKQIQKGDIVLDIGANIGYFTLIFANIVGPTGKVFAFEPDPNNFALLKRNIEVNNYKNVILVNKAVSNHNGKIKLYLSETNHGDHMISNFDGTRSSIDIDCIKLDDFFKDYQRKIDFIKMDIQGAEFIALQGMSNILNSNQKLKMSTEFEPIRLKKCGVEAIHFLDLLSKHNFKFKDIVTPIKKVIPINVDNLLKLYSVEKANYTNILCEKL